MLFGVGIYVVFRPFSCLLFKCKLKVAELQLQYFYCFSSTYILYISTDIYQTSLHINIEEKERDFVIQKRVLILLLSFTRNFVAHFLSLEIITALKSTQFYFYLLLR